MKKQIITTMVLGALSLGSTSHSLQAGTNAQAELSKPRAGKLRKALKKKRSARRIKVIKSNAGTAKKKKSGNVEYDWKVEKGES